VGQRPKSGQARWLAPLAVAVLAIALLIVAAGSSVDESGNGNGSPRTTAEQTTTSTVQSGGGGEKHYVVQPGDTLSSIALETGISVAELQAMNPDVDPQALASGERLKLR
jgi:LysM repeat protein